MFYASIFFFKQKTAYEMLRSLVGSEMCIRDRCDCHIVATDSRVEAAVVGSVLRSATHVPEDFLGSLCRSGGACRAHLRWCGDRQLHGSGAFPGLCVDTVSYTHLTLPTKRIV
eukprot:TRINITY_DN33782_c0_g1_i1.p1 TRINITY_DN33782_c0_g1~~TRINITY_DN33782_c0_g1_i1.p1  ORF type:complete len:113 (-),score=19.44 TRINITY_DN33782_c0_g1_i1:63-401(-)